MKIDKNILIELINKEIKWCRDSRNKKQNGISENELKWFVKGLKQSINLINEITLGE
ncbi:TPA: hypothetical protein I9082_002648 [Clostridium perfringens]|nr:hypothetical protein [Clostridium perfringens]